MKNHIKRTYEISSTVINAVLLLKFNESINLSMDGLFTQN